MKISLFFLIFPIILFLSLSAHSKVSKISGKFFFEGESIKIAGTALKSIDNPTVIKLIDGKGTVFSTISPEKNTKTFIKFTVPDVSSSKVLILEISGGDIAPESSEKFPLVIFNKADSTNPSPGPIGQDGDINADSVILEGYALKSDSNGNLLWNDFKVANKDGHLVTDRITLDGIALNTDTNLNLTWNSHIIATPAGGVAAASLSTTDTALTIKGGNVISLDTNNHSVDLDLPQSGQLAAILSCPYDYAVDSGVSGAIKLRNCNLPNTSIVTRAWYQVITPYQSATNTSQIGISIPGDDVNGILNPTAINSPGSPWGIGIHDTLINGLVNNFSNKTTAIKQIEMTITGEALTAGKAYFYIEYMTLVE
jgi:hypothetical protein